MEIAESREDLDQLAQSVCSAMRLTNFIDVDSAAFCTTAMC
jgi:hypothetical protein